MTTTSVPAPTMSPGAADDGAGIERASPDDVTQLAVDVGAVPMQVGAVLVLDGTGGFDAGEARRLIAARIAAVPRLRQRLVSAPAGCGRPVWVDDPAMDLDEHLTIASWPAPGDEDALLDLGARAVTTRLSRDRPLWSATVVEGGPGGDGALIVVFHHALADGIGGLAVLASLVDGAPALPPLPPPRSAPSPRQLFRDAMAERWHALVQLPRNVRLLRAAVAELRPAGRAHLVRCSLNRPTGGRRRFAVVRADLERVHTAARAQSATINDVVLAAITGALHRLLLTRGERVDRFVISVPVSARRATVATELGNQAGVIPVDLPATGDPHLRVRAITTTTRAAKDAPRAASSALLGPVFRALARLGIFGWFIDRQHLVHTFVTNLRGPEVPLRFAGAPIRSVIPLTVVTGNVTVSFAVLSYAGTLGVTIIADPDAAPDVDQLQELLQDELDALT